MTSGTPVPPGSGAEHVRFVCARARDGPPTHANTAPAVNRNEARGAGNGTHRAADCSPTHQRTQIAAQNITDADSGSVRKLNRDEFAAGQLQLVPFAYDPLWVDEAGAAL